MPRRPAYCASRKAEVGSAWQSVVSVSPLGVTSTQGEAKTAALGIPSLPVAHLKYHCGSEAAAGGVAEDRHVLESLTFRE